eukprot:scaffold44813_cov62-Phaeocystis_antarctica.AAC.3
MAAKDKVCGNNLVALKDLDLGAWIDRPGDIDCEDQRWIGAPDPTDNLKHWSGFDPCADSTPRKNLYTLKDPRPAKGMYFAWRHVLRLVHSQLYHRRVAPVHLPLLDHLRPRLER